MLNVVIPMAGRGSRFLLAGQTLPKPLIPIKNMGNKPMIQVVVENLNIRPANYIFIIQKEHNNKYNLKQLLETISPNCQIVPIDKVTEGAACTVLLAKKLIDYDNPLLIANSDQFIEWDSFKFISSMRENKVDGGILTFESNDPNCSYAFLGEDGYVKEVAEKRRISKIATVGLYYWANGSNYVKYAEQMISKNIRTNNEFYVCPVFAEAISDKKKINTFNIDKVWSLGDPDALERFEKKYKL